MFFHGAVTNPAGGTSIPLALNGWSKILIKRDDQTSLALGGNKVRKLKFLVIEGTRLIRALLREKQRENSWRCSMP